MPRERLPIPASQEEWLSHTKSDLRLAILAREDRGILYAQVCFHAQQAAEKAVKAVLLMRTLNFPLTHDIAVLVDILRASGYPLPDDLAEIDTLTPFAVETRYPGISEAITNEEVSAAIILAKSAVRWAEEVIQ